MEAMQTEVARDGGDGGSAFSTVGVLRAALRAWWRNARPLTATMVLLTLPALVLDTAWPRDPHTGVARPLLVLLIGLTSGVVAATALGAAGLDSVRGNRPRVVPAMARGLAWGGGCSWSRCASSRQR